MRWILAVWAHPDDEAFGPVPTFCLAHDRGYQTAVIVATRGEGGNPDAAQLAADETLGDVRERELQASARVLSVDRLIIWDYGDGKLHERDHDALTIKVVAVMRELEPEIVLTFGPDGITGHPDHVAIHAITTRAFHAYTAMHNDPTHRLLYVTIGPERGEIEKMGDAPDPFPANVVLDLPQYASRKREALECHASQRADWEAQLDRPSWLTTDYFYQAYPPHTANTLLTTLFDDEAA